ncbi:MAG: hypothetical protein CVV41_15650 [Candidatus Riflebacteria bacterium HGW-Riflebacteria-1]|jgi:MinD-like ATPase involved in chromosome partitioning or flagellar assembly|nr:MAG: hypothetical protein CVV41_15650 [Candidatus Riflebacteria bacterium HGW-Riflebacteria-1]
MTNSPGASSLARKKVLIVDANLENNSVLQNWFTIQPDFELLGVFQSPKIAMRDLELFSPDLVLVGIDIPNGIKFSRILRQKYPAVCIIALVGALSPENQVHMRQAGALESLLRGADPDLVGQTIRSVAATEGSTLCSIIGVGGIKEGVGATLLTCILGDFLGRHLPGKILLTDLDFQRADLAFSLGLPAKKHVQELVALENFLYFDTLQNFIAKTPRGCSLIPAAQEPGLKILSDIAFVGLLTALGNFFEVVLVDLPPFPFQGLSEVIDICDTVIINVGETPNQMKTLWWMMNSEGKKMPKSYLEKLLFVSWCQDSKAKAAFAEIVPQCVFLPRPQKPRFSDPAFSVNDSAEFEPLRVALGVLLENIPGLSIYSGMGTSSSGLSTSDSPATSLLSRLIKFFTEK